MINKKKLTPYIWYDNEKFKVEKIISPNKYDDYILISKKSLGHIHEDGKTIPVEMCLLNCDDDFYPDTEEVRQLIENNKRSNDLENKRKEKLSDIWLDLFKDENNELLL